ncbi:hypothetical protein D3C75_822900 [compost metagenome]
MQSIPSGLMLLPLIRHRPSSVLQKHIPLLHIRESGRFSSINSKQTLGGFAASVVRAIKPALFAGIRRLSVFCTIKKPPSPLKQRKVEVLVVRSALKNRKRLKQVILDVQNAIGAISVGEEFWPRRPCRIKLLPHQTV